MSKDTRKILDELYEIDPSFRDKEEELVTIIEKLLAVRPDATMDESFRKNLRKTLSQRIGQKQYSFLSRLFSSNRRMFLRFGLGFAAAAVLAVIAVIAFLPTGTRVALEKKEATSEVISTDKTISKLEDAKPPIPVEITGTIKSEKRKEIITTSTLESEKVDAMVSTGEGSGDMEEMEQSVTRSAVGGTSFEPFPEKEAQKTEGATDGDELASIEEREFLKTIDMPVVTQAIDADISSYANVRLYLNGGTLPPPAAVQIGQLVNYFTYAYPESGSGGQISVHTEISSCPWNDTHRLLLVVITGNENGVYTDTIPEKSKAIASRTSGTQVILAEDSKIQLEINPAKVDSYRLIGDPNTLVTKEFFTNDATSAGALAAGSSAVVLYEIVPGTASSSKTERKSKTTTMDANAASARELLTLRFRYKKPGSNTSTLVELAAIDSGDEVVSASDNFRFAASVAEWGLILRRSAYKGSATFEQVLKLAQGALGKDIEGDRKEFLSLVQESTKLGL